MTKRLGGHDPTYLSPRTGRLVHCSASWPATSLNREMLHSVPRRRTLPAGVTAQSCPREKVSVGEIYIAYYYNL